MTLMSAVSEKDILSPGFGGKLSILLIISLFFQTKLAKFVELIRQFSLIFEQCC